MHFTQMKMKQIILENLINLLNNITIIITITKNTKFLIKKFGHLPVLKIYTAI